MSLGIYISVPFCRMKCSYCNFASGVFARSSVAQYVERLCTDIGSAEKTVTHAGGVLERTVDSVYLGGGTPTILDPSHLEKIFGVLREQFEVEPAAEVTMECAPGSLTPVLLDCLPRLGVNRVSLGVQSFIDDEAAAVGRQHTRSVVREDIASLRAAGIGNINVDLIAGLPHQTMESWRQSLNEALATGVSHVSVYMLEVDEDSRLGRELMAGGTRYHAHFVPDDDLIADLYTDACAVLSSSHVAQYEISNFAPLGIESKHNLKYWTRQPYLGFGLDAHSMLEADPYVLLGTGSAVVDESAACMLEGVDADAVRLATTDSLEEYLAGAAVQHSVVSNFSALEE
ncbi:MAG: radical SAM family heme chaperone HemW, partial [Acidobacteriaceae bacterium]|nr:radical SAM family heme chaperone HemW [Acidobacteriaceae bacterium]